MNFIDIIQENFMSAFIYWTSFLISIFLSFLYQKSRIISRDNGTVKIRSMSKSVQIIWTLLIIIAPSLVIGIRDYSVGADTINVVNSYVRIDFVDSFSGTIDDIIGSGFIYALLRYFAFIISNGNITFYLLCLSLLTLYILVRALNEWIDRISLPFALFLYYAFFAMQLLNQTRQMLALSIFLLAFYPLFKRNYGKYILLILIASLIHYTALIGLFLPLIHFRHTYFYPIKKWFYYLMIVLSPLLLYPVFILITYVIPGSYRGYLTDVNFEGIGFGLFLNIIPILLPILLFNRYLKDDTNEFFIKISMLSFPLRLSGYYSYFIMRMYYYGAISIILIIPTMVNNIEGQVRRRFVLISIITLYLLYYLINYMYLDTARMFPYKSIFSNL